MVESILVPIFEDACVLQERARNMKNLKFASGSRRVRRYDRVLRPRKNSFHRDFLRSDTRDWEMLRQMPVISDIGLKGQTHTEVLGRRLQKTEILSVATHDR